MKINIEDIICCRYKEHHDKCTCLEIYSNFGLEDNLNNTFLKNIDTIIIDENNLTLKSLNAIGSIINASRVKKCILKSNNPRPVRFFSTLFKIFKNINDFKIEHGDGMKESVFESILFELKNVKLKSIDFHMVKQRMLKNEYYVKIVNLLKNNTETLERVNIDDRFDIGKELIDVLKMCRKLKIIGIYYCKEDDFFDKSQLMEIIKRNKNQICKIDICKWLETNQNDPYTRIVDSNQYQKNEKKYFDIFFKCKQLNRVNCQYLNRFFLAYKSNIKNELLKFKTNSSQSETFDLKYFNWKIIQTFKRDLKESFNDILKNVMRNIIKHNDAKDVFELLNDSIFGICHYSKYLPSIIESVSIDYWAHHLIPQFYINQIFFKRFIKVFLPIFQNWIKENINSINKPSIKSICVKVKENLIEKMDKQKSLFEHKTVHQFISNEFPIAYKNLFPELFYKKSFKCKSYHPYKKQQQSLSSDLFYNIIEFVDNGSPVSQQTKNCIRLLNKSIYKKIKNH